MVWIKASEITMLFVINTRNLLPSVHAESIQLARKMISCSNPVFILHKKKKNCNNNANKYGIWYWIKLGGQETIDIFAWWITCCCHLILTGFLNWLFCLYYDIKKEKWLKLRNKIKNMITRNYFQRLLKWSFTNFFRIKHYIIN